MTEQECEQSVREVCEVEEETQCDDIHRSVLYCTVLFCTVLYCSVLYCSVLYCTVLYRRVPHTLRRRKPVEVCSGDTATDTFVIEA